MHLLTSKLGSNPSPSLGWALACARPGRVLRVQAAQGGSAFAEVPTGAVADAAPVPAPAAAHGSPASPDTQPYLDFLAHPGTLVANLQVRVRSRVGPLGVSCGDPVACAGVQRQRWCSCSGQREASEW